MFRRASLLPALGAVAASAVLTTGLSLGVLPAAAYAGDGTAAAAPGSAATHLRRAADDSPLSVTIDTMTPSYVPRKGSIRVTGSVTNRDHAAWRDVNTFAFVSADPLRSTAELAEAAATDPRADVGDRITQPGTFDTLSRIGPGQTAQFSITVPHRLLAADEDGVYWFGVHALGEGPDGRTEGADGRARTFLPKVVGAGRRVDTALVLPLRHAVRRTPDGSLRDEDAWTGLLAPDGPLGALVDLGTAAGKRPVTWLLDPALPDAVAQLAAGNPPRSIAPTVPDRSSGGATQDPSVSPSPSPSTSSGDGSSDSDPASTAATRAASAWLERLKEGLTGSQVLALPYGDVDVAAAARHSPSLYRRARARTGNRLPGFGVRLDHAVAPPDGLLSRRALHLAGRRDTVLVSDTLLAAAGDPVPTVVRTAGQRVVTLSSGASAGGPGPQDPLSPIAVRQRILAEAAVRLLEPGRPQLATLLPQDWAPTDLTGFFDGLDVDWVHLTSVRGLLRQQATPLPPEDVAYPRSAMRREVGAPSFASANALARLGRVLQDVLLNNTDVADTVAEQAYTGTSYAARRRPFATRAATDRARGYLQGQLGSVTIEAPRAVTLSSASGRFAATVRNGLDQPVRVSITAISDEPLSITAPDTVEIGPGGSSTVLLNAATTRPGIHNVTLRLTDGDGTPLGPGDTLPIRSAQVSNVIWLILGAGVCLLFGAIVVRLFRRVRAAARAARAQ